MTRCSNTFLAARPGAQRGHLPLSVHALIRQPSLYVLECTCTHVPASSAAETYILDELDRAQSASETALCGLTDSFHGDAAGAVRTQPITSSHSVLIRGQLREAGESSSCRQEPQRAPSVTLQSCCTPTAEFDGTKTSAAREAIPFGPIPDPSQLPATFLGTQQL